MLSGMLVHLPQLLALSASSRSGEASRRASPRHGSCLRSVPAFRPPPRFRDYADYARVVGQLERSGCIPDYTHIWWDIRPHRA